MGRGAIGRSSVLTAPLMTAVTGALKSARLCVKERTAGGRVKHTASPLTSDSIEDCFYRPCVHLVLLRGASSRLATQRGIVI